jgi:hypothetical protein
MPRYLYSPILFPDFLTSNSGALVRQRTIPTDRPPLVEVSAKFSGQRVSRGQRNESSQPLIIQVAPQLSSRVQVDPRSIRTVSQKIW